MDMLSHGLQRMSCTEMAEASDSELDDEEFGNMPLDANRIIELYTSAEADF
jgi:hypothetical protein